MAIDATPLAVSTGGITRYTIELSRALAETYPEDEIFMVSDQAFELPAGAPANLKRGRGPKGRLERYWWLWGLDRELGRIRAEIFHGTNFAVPYLPRRASVLSLHDLSPWMEPGWHHAADRVRRRTPLLIKLGVATMILTDSEAVRKQALDWFQIHPNRIVAVPLAAASRFRPVQPKFAWRYFLFVGTLEPRKNVHGLIEAWRAVRREHPVELVLAGRRRADFGALEPEPGLRVLGEVSDEDLPALYSGALAFVYPSWYEGFGLPVLEAMQCGAAVIASQGLSELTEEAAIRVDPSDIRALAEAMRALLTGTEWARGLREKSLRRAREFSWQRTARLTREVYEEARRRFEG
jgi:glycosyltransferase involved in cell wall biosynthesis